MQCSLGISNFLEEISSLSYSISLHCLLRKTFLSLLSIPWNSALNGCIFSFSPLPLAFLLFSAIYKASLDNHFAFLRFFFLGMVLIPSSCTMSQTSIHSSSGTLWDLISWIYLSLPLYNHKGFDLGHTWMVQSFPYFFQFKSEFCNREFIWATVSSWSCFCWLYRASPSLAVKNIIRLISVLTIWWRPCVESSLVLLEEGVWYDQCVLLAKLY